VSISTSNGTSHVYILDNSTFESSKPKMPWLYQNTKDFNFDAYYSHNHQIKIISEPVVRIKYKSMISYADVSPTTLILTASQAGLIGLPEQFTLLAYTKKNHLLSTSMVYISMTKGF
jgi:hypothetical protein